MDKNNPSKLKNILKNLTKKYILEYAEKQRKKAYSIGDIFRHMELDLISSMHRAFLFHKREEAKEGFSWEQWQLSKLRAIEEYRKRNRDIVEEYSKPIQDVIDREIQGNFNSGEENVKKLLNKAKEAGIILPSEDDKEKNNKPQLPSKPDMPDAKENRDIPEPERNFFGMNDKKLEALQKSVENDLKKAQYSVLKKMDDVYRQTIFKTHVYLQSGATSLNKAIDMATKDFLEKGIDSITYSDGKKVNIASYAEMCLRTASQRATFLGEGKRRDECGIYLVVVTAHANTCAKCEPWQGKVLIDDVFSHPSKDYIQEHSSKYRLLSEAIKSGFLHPNCRHTLTTYFEGITNLPEVPDGKKAIKTYEAEQKQRKIERELRKWRRIEAGTLDPLQEGKAKEKVEELQQLLKSHISNNPELRRAEGREGNNIRINRNGDNGLNNNNKYLDIPKETVEHADRGDLTNPKNPKKIKPNELKLKKGGHGETGIELLKEKQIEYNIVKEYSNGVRIGNVPNHKLPKKRIGTGQAWFPKDWTPTNIEEAAKYVANLKIKNQYMLEKNYSGDNLISIFKFANYKGVTVGVCYDVEKAQITTIFPDENQRMLRGD